MEWQDLPLSPLWRLLKRGKLKHPTSTAFDGHDWQEALETLEKVSQRDRDLITSALWCGFQIMQLRAKGIPIVTSQGTRAELVELLSAFLNHQFLTVRHKSLTELRKRKKAGQPLDLDQAARMLVSGAGEQSWTPDDLITYLIDSLPHWLFHVWKKEEDGPAPAVSDPMRFAAVSGLICSIEHSLKDLWQEAVWSGTAMIYEGEAMIDIPRDRDLAAHWAVFDAREQNLMGFEQNLEAGAHIVTGGKLAPVTPVLSKTVIRLERQPSGSRKIVTGRALGTKRQQRGHVLEQDMLERLYTGLFLDEPLPLCFDGSVTCRELSRTWWLLKDLAELLAEEFKSKFSAEEALNERFAAPFRRTYLVDLLKVALGISGERAGWMLQWLTCDPTDAGSLFSRSVWNRPLIPDPSSDRLHLLLAPLLAASPVKRVESWMERGGISDSHGVKGRGKPFERHVRSELAEAISSNPLLTDAVVAEHGLKRKNNSEEIDLLLRIGQTIVVGEVKCFVAPSEPIERFNHLGNLAEATTQAKNKLLWAEANRGALVAALGGGHLNPDDVKIVPLVVINSSFGSGLERSGVPIVDLHYLRLLLGHGSYQGDTRFEKGLGMVYQPVELYKSQPDLEQKLEQRLRNPPPLQRYYKDISWRRVPFRTLDNTPFYIEVVNLPDNVPNVFADMQTRGNSNTIWRTK